MINDGVRKKVDAFNSRIDVGEPVWLTYDNGSGDVVYTDSVAYVINNHPVVRIKGIDGPIDLKKVKFVTED